MRKYQYLIQIDIIPLRGNITVFCDLILALIKAQDVKFSGAFVLQFWINFLCLQH